jgi:hypothetical protein
MAGKKIPGADSQIADIRYAMVVTAIKTVASQPNTCQVRETVNGPRIRVLLDMSIAGAVTRPKKDQVRPDTTPPILQGPPS